MPETLGPFTVDTADGTLRPAVGVVMLPGPVADFSGAVGVESTIDTCTAFADEGDALAEALAYRGIVGAQITFRGVPCFVANAVPDHHAARGEAEAAKAVCRWTLVAYVGWVP